MKKRNMKRIKNEKGMAIVESLPLVIIFIVLIAYMFGSFGVIHTAVLHSIASRNYAFEIFRHRTNLKYLRDDAGSPNISFSKEENRVHVINHENGRDMGNGIYSTERRLAMGIETSESSRTESIHNQGVYTVVPGQQNNTIGVNPVWIMTAYGICLNANCGGGQ